MGRNTSEFVPVARVDVVPSGAGIVAYVGQVPVAVFNVAGSIYVTGNMCPHRGGPLADGELKGCEVTCPWHAWRFDVRDGHSPTHQAARIVTYPVHVESGEILIGIG